MHRHLRKLPTLAGLLTLLTSGLGTAPAAEAAPTTFAHPGVLNSRAQLDFVRAKVKAA